MCKSLSATFAFFLASIMTGCAASQLQPTKTIPPPTQTALPPTDIPTPAPTPTWTPIPYGTLHVCNYYEGVKVEGLLRISKDGVPLDAFGAEQKITGCTERKLHPGVYEVTASWGNYQVHCYAPGQSIEVLPGERVEVDLHYKCPE